MIWATLIPVLEKRFTMKGAYAISLIVGAIGFISIYFVQDITGTYNATITTDAQTSNAIINLVLINSKYVILLSYLLIGAAWAAMLAIPFTIITNVISGSKNMGTLLGLFNCTICLPQIIAGAFGGSLLNYIGGSQSGMMVAAGVLLILGAFCVSLIKDKK
jgi:maltose/moltooligosaccharide transporter